MLGRALLGLGITAFVAAACGSTESDSGCKRDAECKTDETCQKGVCVKLGGDAGTDAGADAADAQAVCLGKQASPTAAGPCGCSTDCDAPELCLDELGAGVPRGLCMRACPDGTCPGDLVCLQQTPGMPGSEACLRTCATNADCPSSQICITLESGGQLVCFPFCASDADCPALGKCDPYTGMCSAAPVYPGQKEPGDACADDAECKSELCISGISKFPDGYCSAFCSLEKQGCPEGSHCMPIWSDIGDQGLCMKKCNDVGDCRTGYGCVSSSKMPGVTVCGPPSG